MPSAGPDIPVTVRTYEPRDADACRRLYVEGLLGGKLADNDTGLDIDDIPAAYLHEHNSHFWVAELDGEVVGMVGVQHYDGVGEIRRLRVRNDIQRRGIGSKLVEVAVQFCQEHGYLKVELDTYVDRDPAVKLFEKFRFRHSRTKNVAGKDKLFFLSRPVRHGEAVGLRRIDCLMNDLLTNACNEVAVLADSLKSLAPQLQKLGETMLAAWAKRGKVLTCGNGGSACDALHLAEELAVRFQKNRRGLAAMALLDPTALTCAGNDFGYDELFARQVDAHGNPGDVLVGFTTSGNSANVLRAFDRAKSLGLITVAFLGRDGGKARGLCDIELIVPADLTHRIQEGHEILFHTLCEWIDQRVD